MVKVVDQEMKRKKESFDPESYITGGYKWKVRLSGSMRRRDMDS
jgi:hypothetical protein